MGFSIDIDTGGTFTDGFVRGNGKIELVKVPTTPHDLTLCFMECIEEAAKKLGYETASRLLPQTDTVRLSTTIGTNALINGSGPKLGLLVTRGAGENAYAPSGTSNPAINFLVPKDMVIGIDEEMSETGVSIKPPSSVEVLTAIKNLLERGARRIVVSLERSPLNPAHEKLCREIVLANYPAHYLGTVPLLLSTEISTEIDDQYRTNAALIDAYIHQDMAHYLYKADDDVRKNRFKWPLLIVHATGGVCRVAKTKAIDTCDSGPAAGLFGAAFLARLYGLDNVVTVDIGGTSTDVGVVIHGEPTYTREKDLGGVPVRESAIETVSIGGGGSSVIKVDKSGKLTVGPESMGGIPGPACFGLGGTNACVTDTWVTLGYIDPDFFLGGRRKLDTTKAKAAIKRRISDPLKNTEVQAAESALNRLTSQCADLVREFTLEKEIEVKDITMFAFGGGGGLLCPGIAKAAGIGKIYFFRFGAQFCAFGSSCTDVLHDYSIARNLELTGAGELVWEEFNKTIQQMQSDAYFDMEGEGFGKEKVSFVLEVMMTSEGSPSPISVRWSPMFLKNKADVEDLLDLYRARATSCEKQHKVFVREFRLKASCHLADPEFTVHTSAGESPEKALKGQRTAYFSGESCTTPIYDEGRLECGNVVKGPGFIESPHTTILVPPGSRYTVDKYLNGLMEEE
jgi:N-methylhydantoinase A